jgi:hypothetical protein
VADEDDRALSRSGFTVTNLGGGWAAPQLGLPHTERRSVEVGFVELSTGKTSSWLK